MLLTCPDEARRVIGATFQAALSQPEVRAALIGGGPISLRLGLVDPDCVLYIDTATMEVVCDAPEDLRATAMVAMYGDTALSLCQGRIDLVTALSTGLVAADGDYEPVLVALASGAGLTDRHVEVLTREGRADLLVA